MSEAIQAAGRPHFKKEDDEMTDDEAAKEEALQAIDEAAAGVDVTTALLYAKARAFCVVWEAGQTLFSTHTPEPENEAHVSWGDAAHDLVAAAESYAETYTPWAEANARWDEMRAKEDEAA